MRHSGPNALIAALEQQLGGPELRGPLAAGGVEVPPQLWSRAFTEPVRDFLSRKGKNFRARMVSLCWRLVEPVEAVPEDLGLLIEYIHSGSLIIDDIQDGSVERRGEPSMHQRYGVPLALCLGNWLYFFPFTFLETMSLDPTVELALRRHMIHCMLRCHHGQALDLTVRCYSVERARLPALVRTITDWKTGSLFELAAVCGALPAGASSEQLDALSQFASAFGRVLQNVDDVGGLRLALRGLKRHDDLLGARATYSWALLAELLDDHTFGEFQARAQRCEAQGESPNDLARDILSVVGEESTRRVSTSLDALLTDLRSAFGSNPVVTEVEVEANRLISSYG